MLLGIFFHSASVFITAQNWRISSENTSLVFDVMTDFIHYFRMDAFYIIAGFFFVLVFEKKGLKSTLKERIIKLGVPLLFVGFTLNTVMNAFSDNHTYHKDINYILDGQWLGHLWFIGNLLVYYFLASPLLLVLDKLHIPKQRWIALFITFILTPVLVAIFSIIGAKVHTGRLIFISFNELFSHLPFFMLGMYCWKVREQVIPLLTMKSSALTMLVFSCSKLVESQYLSNLEISWSVSVVYTSFMNICLGIAAIAFLNSVGKNRNVMVDKLVGASYSIYLIHQPLIVLIFGLILTNLNMNIYLTFITLCTSVCVISYMIHTKVIAKSPLLSFLLNGKK